MQLVMIVGKQRFHSWGKCTIASLVPRLFFRMQREKIVWSTAYSIYIQSTTMMALQLYCFMRVMSHTAINGNQSAMQKTKPGRTREQTSEGMPGLL